MTDEGSFSVDCIQPTLLEPAPNVRLNDPAIATFTVPGEPKGKGRHRSRIAGPKGGKQFVHSYAPKETVEYENLVRMAASSAMNGKDPHTGPVKVRLEVACSIPKSWSNKRHNKALAGQILPTGKPDLDNVEKAILDGLNKIVVRDDAQVCFVTKWKRYAATPGVKVWVTAIDAEAA